VGETGRRGVVSGEREWSKMDEWSSVEELGDD
jgi:hypothetical protein